MELKTLTPFLASPSSTPYYIQDGPRFKPACIGGAPRATTPCMWQRLLTRFLRRLNALRRSSAETQLRRIVLRQADEVTQLRARIRILEADARVATHEAMMIAGELERIKQRGLADIAESALRTRNPATKREGRL